MNKINTYLTCIIILNWNSLKNTINCLKSLLNITDVKYKILLLDNASTRNEVTIINNKFCGLIDTIRLSNNLGFTGACNYGVKIALKKYNPDFVLLLNNDTEVKSDFLKYLVLTASSDKKIGIVGSLLRDFKNRTQINYAGGEVDWLQAKPYRETAPLRDIKKTTIITGCSMLIKKELIKKIGLFDNKFFAYFEDSVYCLKTIKAGYDCVCDPRSIVYHKEQSATGKTSKIYTYLMSRNRILFVNNYFPIYYRVYFLVFNFFKLLAVTIYFNHSKQNKLAYAYLRGYVDGMRGIGGPPRI